MRRPIDVSPDGRFLVTPSGEPFFWLGDTAWQLFHRLDLDESDHYLADRAARGFTVVQAVATGKIYDDWRAAPNAAGHVPFRDGDPLRPDEDYFAHVDRVIERAAAHGLVVALLPIWAASAVVSDPPILHGGNAERYGRWIGARYRDAGVVWVLGGDVNPVWSSGGGAALVDHRPVYDALAAGILAGAGDDAFLTYHPTPVSPVGVPSPRTSSFFADRHWLAMNMIESGHSDLGEVDEVGGRNLTSFGGAYMLSAPSNHRTIAAEYASSPTRPIVDGETRYEDHPVIDLEGDWKDLGAPLWTAFHQRSAIYHALFAGAAGHTYGHVSLWDLHRAADRIANPYLPDDLPRPDWEDALRAPGADQMRHAKALLLSRPYFSRIPDDSLVTGEPGSGDARIGATRDADRSWAMLYIPDGRAVSVVPGALRAERATGWWFDPRSGEATRIADELHPGAGIRLTPPEAGADRVLVLDDAARGYPPPGTPFPG